jgi:sporulation protein YlmC with PRC-barrel domain
MADSPIDQASYRGHEVIDDHADHVGTVTDVVYSAEGQPEWVVVNPGLLRAAHYVPVAGSYLTEDGALTIPFTKAHVKAAPKATSDHVITNELERELVRHYELV